MTHGDIEDVDITKMSQFIRDMTGIGVLVPDDGLEDYIRQVGHLPERTSDTRENDHARQNQQERNEPPEPETAVGNKIGLEDEEIPEEKTEAARKRLRRGG